MSHPVYTLSQDLLRTGNIKIITTNIHSVHAPCVQRSLQANTNMLLHSLVTLNPEREGEWLDELSFVTL